MKIVISGGSGFVGRGLIDELLRHHEHGSPGAPLELICLSRSPERAQGLLNEHVSALGWAPHLPLEAKENSGLNGALDGADAVIHLAGEPAVGARLTEAKKTAILKSRVGSTKLLVQAMKATAKKPNAFVCVSGVGYYGHHEAADPVDESSGPGADFLALVCIAWEAAAEEATALGVRVVRARLGIVLGPDGGALQAMALPIRNYVGGKLGRGIQMVSWIHLVDAARALVRAATDENICGPINLTSPYPVSNEELTKTIGHLLNRPTFLTVPALALALVFGEGAGPLLTGQRALPQKLRTLDFVYRFPNVTEAVRDALKLS